jgi:hypothetical protein
MARLRSLEHTVGSSRFHPTEVDGLWSVVISKSGEQFLQLSTYGSDARQSDSKVSQTVQLNVEMAAVLKKAIERTFPMQG